MDFANCFRSFVGEGFFSPAKRASCSARGRRSSMLLHVLSIVCRNIEAVGKFPPAEAPDSGTHLTGRFIGSQYEPILVDEHGGMGQGVQEQLGQPDEFGLCRHEGSCLDGSSCRGLVVPAFLHAGFHRTPKERLCVLARAFSTGAGCNRFSTWRTLGQREPEPQVFQFLYKLCFGLELISHRSTVMLLNEVG